MRLVESHNINSYSKTEIEEKLNRIGNLNIVAVQDLPAQGELGKMYIKQEDMYVWDGRSWIKINGTRFVPGAIKYIKRELFGGSTANTSHHFSELQAFVGNSNILRGIVPTVISGSPEHGLNLSRLTDGDTTSYQGFSNNVSLLFTLPEPQAVDYIKMFHYYPDGRTYNGIRLSTSSDNRTWTVRWNSAVHGTYRETNQGKRVDIN